MKRCDPVVLLDCEQRVTTEAFQEHEEGPFPCCTRVA